MKVFWLISFVLLSCGESNKNNVSNIYPSSSDVLISNANLKIRPNIDRNAAGSTVLMYTPIDYGHFEVNEGKISSVTITSELPTLTCSFSVKANMGSPIETTTGHCPTNSIELYAFMKDNDKVYVWPEILEFNTSKNDNGINVQRYTYTYKAAIATTGISPLPTFGWGGYKPPPKKTYIQEGLNGVQGVSFGYMLVSKTNISDIASLNLYFLGNVNLRSEEKELSTHSVGGGRPYSNTLIYW